MTQIVLATRTPFCYNERDGWSGDDVGFHKYGRGLDFTAFSLCQVLITIVLMLIKKRYFSLYGYIQFLQMLSDMLQP